MDSKINIVSIDKEKIETIKRVEAAIEDFKAGKMLILVDDEDRENEGDLVVAAEKAAPSAINFMARFGRGLICLALSNEIADRLDLPLMVSNNTALFNTGFTVSIDAKSGITTGISAQDRAHTIAVTISEKSIPADLARPGHIFPLRAKDGGVLVRTGQTEGSVDLARLSEMKCAAVICEIMNEDGTMSRRHQLEEFSKVHGVKILSVADIIKYRIQNESLVREVASSSMPLDDAGDTKIIAFENDVDSCTHLAVVKGDVSKSEPVLVRVHSECLTGDVFGSARCDCGEQLSKSLEMIKEAGCGVLLYVRQEGRGITDLKVL